MSPAIVLPVTLAPPPCLTWTDPPMREPPLTFTERAFSAWTLPTTRMPDATSVALRSTLTVPLTLVPLSVHVAPCGHAQVVDRDRAERAAAGALLGERDGRERQRQGDAARQRGELVRELHATSLLGGLRRPQSLLGP